MSSVDSLKNYLYNISVKFNRNCLQGGVKFPTGGIARNPFQWLIWLNSRADSIVWYAEDSTTLI